MFVAAAIFTFISIANGILMFWRFFGKRNDWIEFVLHLIIFILAGTGAAGFFIRGLKEKKH